MSQIVGDAGLKRKLTKDYLSHLKLEGAVFDAGYGCFSSVPKRFIFPHVERTDEIKCFVKNEFPEVDFLIWDTKIFAPFYHHTQTHHISFVEIEKEALFSVHEKLYEKYRNVLKER